MVYADIWNERIYINSEIRDKDRIKQIPGSLFNSDVEQWHLPISYGSCVALRGVFGLELQIGEALNNWAAHYIATRVTPAMNLRPAMEVPELMESEPKLFPFQRVGVRFLETVGSGLIADDMGSGKTIQIIRALARLQPLSRPVLVVCPNSMKYTWRDEILAWSDLIPMVIDGSVTQRRKQIASAADVYIINWEALRLHSRIAGYGSISLTPKESESKELNEIAWGTVVADEGHRAKDPKSKQTRALWAVADGANYRIAATGTPIESHPGELWSILHFVSPEDFPRKTKYVERYCAQAFNPFGGMEITGLQPEHAIEFHKIVDPLVLRRPKDVILPQLPPKTETVRYIPFSGKQATVYRQMKKEMVVETDSGHIVALNPLQKFIRLSQFASSYAEMSDGKPILTMPSNKIDALLDLLEEAGHEQIVVFAESKQLIRLTAQQLDRKAYRYGVITSDTTADQRAAYVREFQEGRLQIMLCTSAGSEGITLTAARILVFLQRFWSSITNQQAADRIHRIGQERGVEIITFATIGTVDEARERALSDKTESLQEVLQDDVIRKQILGWS